MIKFIRDLFTLRDSEIQTLKEQLQFERERVKELTEILIHIVQPKAMEVPTIDLSAVQQRSALFSRRRAALEEKDRLEAATKKSSTYLGKPDDQLKQIDQLEKELGVEEPAKEA